MAQMHTSIDLHARCRTRFDGTCDFLTSSAKQQKLVTTSIIVVLVLLILLILYAKLF